MKLNIYENKEVKKTYEADTYDLMWGTVEDVAKAIDLDSLNEGTDVEIIKMIGTLIIKSRDTVNGLLKDIFEGLTDKELRNVKVSEITDVLIDVVMFTIKQLSFGKRKN